ncbi:hypothetical protein [Spirosoma pollinicola]|nr:hypothetical protein [Spirosoma pollinicola]
MLSSKRQSLNQKEWLPRAIELKATGMALIPISKQLIDEGHTNCGKSIVGIELSKHYATQQDKGNKPLFTIDDIDFDALNEYNEDDEDFEDIHAFLATKDQ